MYIYIYTYIYIYIYIFRCVCVCVCALGKPQRQKDTRPGKMSGQKPGARQRKAPDFWSDKRAPMKVHAEVAPTTSVISSGISRFVWVVLESPFCCITELDSISHSPVPFGFSSKKEKTTRPPEKRTTGGSLAPASSGPQRRSAWRPARMRVPARAQRAAARTDSFFTSDGRRFVWFPKRRCQCTYKRTNKQQLDPKMVLVNSSSIRRGVPNRRVLHSKMDGFW